MSERGRGIAGVEAGLLTQGPILNPPVPPRSTTLADSLVIGGENEVQRACYLPRIKQVVVM